MTALETAPGVGPLLRDWRRRRRVSQLDLALDAGVSARHVSFVETGRSRPSREMVLHLAEQLEVPLRERNQLLLAAGYAPVYAQRGLDDPDMTPVREAIEQLLAGHEPYPAVVVDGCWDIVAANRGIELFTADVAPELLEPPANALRLALHPKGMAPRIANLAQWRGHLLHRLAREVALGGDAALAALQEEVLGFGPPTPPAQNSGAGGDILVPLRLRTVDGELAFFASKTTFGTPIDVTVSELSIESFFPADAATAAAVRAR